MQRNKLTIFGQAIAACALLFWGLPMMQPMAPAQTVQDTQVEKPVKAKKIKKSASDAATSQTPASIAPATKKGAVAAPVSNASAADIQSAKTSGKVWVNTDSGVYHKSGKWFGTTKQGKFMTEQDAMKAGYKAAKNEK